MTPKKRPKSCRRGRVYGVLLGVQTKKQPITGKYAKRLTETISRGKSDSETQSTINPTNHTGSSDKKYEVIWE